MKRNLLKVFFSLIYTGSFVLFVLTIKKFEIKKLIIISYPRNINSLWILNNKNLLFMNSESIAASLLNNNQDLSFIYLEKIFPDMLIMRTKERIPIAYINRNNLFYLYDENGFIRELSEFNTEKIPEMATSIQHLSKFRKIDWRITKALSYIVFGLKKGIIIDRIEILDLDDIYVLTLQDLIKVIVPQKNDAGIIIASLQIITSRFRIEGKFINSIDFRVDKPIVLLKDEDKNSSSKL